jgi:hypothetical protein
LLKDVFVQRTLAINQAESKQRLSKRVLQNAVTSYLYFSNELASQYTNTPNNQRANYYNQDMLYIYNQKVEKEEPFQHLYRFVTGQRF